MRDFVRRTVKALLWLFAITYSLSMYYLTFSAGSDVHQANGLVLSTAASAGIIIASAGIITIIWDD